MKVAKRIERLRALMEQRGLDAVIARSTTDLMWLTGFERVFDTEQAHIAVVTRDACALHTDMRYSTAMRTRAKDEGIWQIDDERVSAAKFVAAFLQGAGLQGGKVLIDADISLALYRALVEENPKVEFVEGHGDILALRAVKEPEEVELMKAAQEVASKSFLEFVGKLHVGMTERDASLELELAMRKNGADELAFANIVASGANSANPHSVPGDRTLQPGDLVVVDFGARLNGYRSDTTRTLCIGQPSKEQLRIYETVKLANEEVRHSIKAGVTGAEMQAVAEAVLAAAGFGGKMGHALGHGVGLDIHEAPLLSPRYDKPLVAGNVVTDEPGIYITGQNGVRIEDCGVVTADGYVNFCGLSHELVVVE